MFVSRLTASAPKDSELHGVAMEIFELALEALETPAIGSLRERSAMTVWATLHGVVMLAEQGMFTGEIAQSSRTELVEEFVAQTKLALNVAVEAAVRAGPTMATSPPLSPSSF